jgi:hypothetical protein
MDVALECKKCTWVAGKNKFVVLPLDGSFRGIDLIDLWRMK